MSETLEINHKLPMPSRPSLQRRRGGRGSKPQPSGAVLRHTRRDLRRFSRLCSCERFTFVKTNFSLAERSSENTSCRDVTPLFFFTRDTWRVGGFESPSTAATEPSRGVGRDAMLSMTRVSSSPWNPRAPRRLMAAIARTGRCCSTTQPSRLVLSGRQ